MSEEQTSDIDAKIEPSTETEFQEDLENGENRSTITEKIPENDEASTVDKTETIADSDITDVEEMEPISEEPDFDETEELITEPISPTFWLIRGDFDQYLSDFFKPTNLLTLIVNQTGVSQQTYVKMIDNRDQVRYHAKSGGYSHQFITRLQDTRTFGEWRLEIEVPHMETEMVDTYILPFSVVEELPEEDVLEVSVIEGDDGYILVFISDEEGMFQVVDRSLFEIGEPEEIVEEVPEEISEIEEEIEKEEELIPEISAEIPAEEPEEVIISYHNTDLPELQIPVSEIHGIGPSYQKRLAEIGVLYVHDILKQSPESLAEVKGVSMSRSQNWIAEAREIADNPSNSVYLQYKEEEEEEEVEEVPVVEEIEIINTNLEELSISVSEIKGVGPSYQKRLLNENISLVHHLLKYNSSSLATILGISEKKTEKWMDQAVSIATDPENEVYQKFVKALEEEEVEELEDIETEEIEIVNTKLFDANIPITEISGIGPATAKKFASAGITLVHHLVPYNAKQLAEAIGLSEKRCEKWLAQADDIANNPDNEIFIKFTS